MPDFFEFETRKQEPILININRISFVIKYKGLAVVYDVDGQQFETNEDYDDFKMRLNAAISLNFDKTYKMYKIPNQ